MNIADLKKDRMKLMNAKTQAEAVLSQTIQQLEIHKANLQNIIGAIQYIDNKIGELNNDKNPKK